MKKIIIALTVVLNCSLLMAQTELDALKYVQTDINGTARYMGMAGAFGALGGDASAIKDNPAGLGIYRSSELSGTMNVMMQNSISKWNGTTTSADDPYKTGLNNFSFVLAMPTWLNENEGKSLINSNWSFSYNRLKNLNRTVNINSGASNSSITDFMEYFSSGLSEADLSGSNEPNNNPYNTTYVPWLSVLAYKGYLINPIAGTNNWATLLNQDETVIPSFEMVERGYIDEYSVGWAGNFSNKLYLGTTLNLQKIDYTLSSRYSEEFHDGGNMALNNTITSSGSGLNLNIGAILRPTDFLRLGLALHTPSIYAMHDTYKATLNYDNTEKGSESTPTDGYNNFQIQGPIQLNASGAYILGSKGLISLEYNFANYTGTRLMNDVGSTQAYNAENQRMSNSLNDVHTIKIGGEYKLTDNFSLRAGYAISTNATKPDAQKIMVDYTTRTDTEYFLNNGASYLTAGFGYREAGWFIDCAYVHKNLNESYMPYNSNLLSTNLAVTPASVISNSNNILLTLGLKF